LIPLDHLPGSARWRDSLARVLLHPAPLWVYGEMGTGVSTVAAWMAAQRDVPLLDGAERLEAGALEAWIEANPKGVLASHRSPADPATAGPASRCLPFRLLALEDDPGSLPLCLVAMAAEEGLQGPLPEALAALPCPGNLVGLRNRLVRWKLLGQLPDPAAAMGGPDLPLASENLAVNLHVLERVLLHRALRRSYGNRAEAAQRLGVSRRQLYLLIARHGDPVRGEAASSAGPKRLRKRQQLKFQDPGAPPISS